MINENNVTLSKLNIVIVMGFYDKNKIKEELTKVQLYYYKLVEESLIDKVNLNFVIVGSEKEKSEQTIYDVGFTKNDYLEFNQNIFDSNDKRAPYQKVSILIGKKYDYGYKYAINNYPELDILLTNGSSDFIPLSFFKNLIKNYSSNEPQIFGIEDLYNGHKGYIYLISNTLNDIIKLKGIKGPAIVKDMKLNFCGGIYGFNKKLIQNLNNTISIPRGNEYVLEQNCINNGNAIPYSNCNWFINFKINNCDVTPHGPIKRRFNYDKIDLENFKKLINGDKKIVKINNELVNSKYNTLLEVLLTN